MCGSPMAAVRFSVGRETRDERQSGGGEEAAGGLVDEDIMDGGVAHVSGGNVGGISGGGETAGGDCWDSMNETWKDVKTLPNAQ